MATDEEFYNDLLRLFSRMNDIHAGFAHVRPRRSHSGSPNFRAGTSALGALMDLMAMCDEIEAEKAKRRENNTVEVGE